MEPDANKLTNASLDDLVRDEQVRQHRRTLPAATAGSLALGVILGLVQSDAVGRSTLLAWLGCLFLVTLARVALYRWHRRSNPEQQLGNDWLRRHRWLSLAHGLVWALASLMLFPSGDLAHQMVLVFALAGICVSVIAGYAFDPRAALYFCVPALLALLARLLWPASDSGTAMAATVTLLIGYVLATGLRSYRALRESVAQRAAQADQVAALRRSHGQLQRAEELAEMGSFAWKPASGALDWSDGHFRLWGHEPGSVEPSLALFLEGVHPADRATVEAMLRASQESGQGVSCQYRICWADGSTHQILGRSEWLRDDQGELVELLGTVQDITQRADIEARLAEKQQLLTVMQQTTQLGFWFLDPQGHTTDVNAAMCGMLGSERNALLGRSIQGFVDADQHEWFRQVLAQPPADGSPGRELTLIRPDGGALVCICHASPIEVGHGKPMGLVCMFSDLSAMARTRDALHVSELVVNSVSDLVSVTDAQGLCQFVNDAWCRRFKLRRDEVIGRPMRDVLPDSVMTRERIEAVDACLRNQEMRTLSASIVFAGDGRRTLETDLTPYLGGDAQVRGVLAVTRDVTQQEATKAALADSLENLRRILNAASDGMIAYDAMNLKSGLLFANDRFFEIWQIPKTQAVSISRRGILDAVRKLYRDPEQEERRAIEIQALDHPFSDRLELRDGRILERTTSPMKGGTGLTRVWTFRDITLQQQAIEALRASDGQQRALMDAFPGFVSVFDQDFVYTYVNARLSGLLDLPPGEIIGRHLRDVVGEARYRQNVLEVERTNNGERVVSERVFEATASRPRVYLQLTHVKGAKGRGRLQRYYAFGVDITDLKRAQEALRAAKEDAERANRAKSAFLASVSHELRTPLNAILGFSQLLRTETQVSQAASDNAGQIERAGRHLLSLVDDLIDLGGVEAGHLELTMERVAVETVINESLSMVAPLAANQGIRIVFDGGDARNAIVMADAVRLRQIIINLLSNAIKYNRPDGTVRVSCFRHAMPSDKGGPRVRIAVTDTGAGIAPEQANRVFSAFERLGAERGAVEGTGIGLAISRRLVAAMGGAIGYESRLREGSTFWIDLAPVKPASHSGREAEPDGARVVQPLHHRQQPRVLVAEDYGPNQAVLKLQLASLGCLVDVVTDGAAALVAWESNPYDLILSDLDMPHMGGHELARAVRRLEAGRRRVPIIAISAAVVQGERARCIAAGMDDMLTKPVTLEGLADMLRRWLGNDPDATTEAAVPNPDMMRSDAAGDAHAVLDLDSLYRILGRVSVRQARELLETFDAAAQVGLRELLDAGSGPASLVREMHRQQSSARTVGALRYAALASALEQHARSHEAIDLDQELARMQEALQDVRGEAAKLDALDPSSLPAELSAHDEPAVACQSVLVVDDDPVVLLQLRQMLAGIGVRDVLTARNGVEALLQMNRRQTAVEVVVCDLNMPEMDGIEMIRRFGQSGFRGGLILMSGADEQLLTTVGNLAQLQGLSVLGQIQKPATPELMRALLGGALTAPANLREHGKVSVMTPQAVLGGIHEGEFSIWFQPKVHLATMKPSGVEALARWRQSDGSYVSPDLFIVVAERAGIIGDLSGVLLGTALREGARLHAAGFPLTISLNLSAAWLDDLTLPEVLMRSAQAVGLTPADIKLEVTETGVTKDIAIALDVLTRLRLKGFGLSIDDFGIGYSSFEQLGRIPFTEMKLDRSFVQRAGKDAAARAILESSLEMARKLELTTVAEGVETEAELALMRELGCDEVQGYLIARPMSSGDLIEWLHLRRT